MMANMLGPIVFIRSLEGRMVLLAAMAGATIQIAIFGSKGFVRLLGIGHLPWVPLLFWLWPRLDQVPRDSIFRYWILSVIVLNALSLIIDTTDVIRYLSGDREPHVVLDPRSSHGEL
jgi:hypothetical protein